jgi:hypothetical protein
VVGRGSHSAGGEASLPRNVERQAPCARGWLPRLGSRPLAQLAPCTWAQAQLTSGCCCRRYLASQGLKYHWRQGAIDVKIRRPFGLVARPS